MIDDGYSCLIDCNQTNVNCSADQTREILFQYRTIPSIQSLDKPLEISRITVSMPTPFVSDFVLHHRYRRDFAIEKVNDHVAIISLKRPIRGPKTEIVRITVNTKTPFKALIAHNLIYIEVHVSEYDF
ncbi:unnamed protein product [Bursaphelenchus xylophilus]|uniref:(pine wood nematode) hypothetical protein n=1 Tax=Bursaphelenchus xylophilus TaxID=6326 RepID=A0A1I7S3U8_BURXY|nr:unnamed protein product [Bursaphelenchus xylophilus]CAG9116519.1 unnamed protein product [Bursaphelenchus xylophilus]